MFEIARIAPVEAEDLGEDRAMLGPRDEAGMQRPVEIRAFGEPRRLDRADRVDDPARAHRQARLAERAGEMDDVLREPRIVGQLEGGVFNHAAASPRRPVFVLACADGTGGHI